MSGAGRAYGPRSSSAMMHGASFPHLKRHQRRDFRPSRRPARGVALRERFTLSRLTMDDEARHINVPASRQHQTTTRRPTGPARRRVGFASLQGQASSPIASTLRREAGACAARPGCAQGRTSSSSASAAGAGGAALALGRDHAEGGGAQDAVLRRSGDAAVHEVGKRSHVRRSRFALRCRTVGRRAKCGSDLGYTCELAPLRNGCSLSGGAPYIPAATLIRRPHPPTGGPCDDRHTASERRSRSRRRRILFRSWHRGMREMDLIMGQFATPISPTSTMPNSTSTRR